jgi:Tfp pilus assembly protein PilV
MHRNRRSGVALLEVLIALLIMAMSALAIAAALGTLGRTGALLTRQDDRLSQTIAVNRLQSWAEAIPPDLIPDSAPVHRHKHIADFLHSRTGPRSAAQSHPPPRWHHPHRRNRQPNPHPE